jgi:hypothetical protein
MTPQTPSPKRWSASAMGSSCWAHPLAMRPSAVSTMANSPPRPSHTRWALQLRLPVALGGAGKRRAVEHSAGAYLASAMRAAEVDGWPAHLASGFAEALEELCEHSGLEAAAVCDPAQARTQRCFSEAVDKQAFASLLAAAPLSRQSTPALGEWPRRGGVAGRHSLGGARLRAHPRRILGADQVVVAWMCLMPCSPVRVVAPP